MRSKGIVFLAIAVATMTGCSLIVPADGCSAIFKEALSVHVQDSASGAMIASGAQLIAHDGAYADSSSFAANRPDLDSLPLEAGGERPGTYAVTVRRAGFRDWTRDGITATKGECHVNTVTLTAALQRIQ